MNKKKTLIITLGLVVLIVGSTVVYKALASNYEENDTTYAVEDTMEVTETLDDTVVSDTESLEEESTELAEQNEDFNADLEQDDTLTYEVVEDSNAYASGNQALVGNTSDSTGSSDSKKPSQNTDSTSEVPTQAPVTTPTTTPGNQGTQTTPTTTPKPTATPQATATPVPTMAPTATPVPTKAPANVNTAANFTVQTYSGSNVSLSSNFGKPIVVNFWASWCGPCKSEMADFNAVYQEYKDKVVFMMVDMVDGSRETKQTGYNYVSGQGYSFPVYYDVNQSAAYAYSVNSYPTTYFIDANGNVATYNKGAMSASSLRNQINKLLN